MALSGSITALATPFRVRDHALDVDACGCLIDYQLAGGTRAIVMAGSTGEAAALEEREFSSLLEFAANRIAKRVPVLAGTGYGTAIAREIAIGAEKAGADGLLLLPPYLVHSEQEGLAAHV